MPRANYCADPKGKTIMFMDGQSIATIAAAQPDRFQPAIGGSVYVKPQDMASCAVVCLSQLHYQKQPFRFREEFRAPLGVRKSPRNEPAGHKGRSMGISVFGRAW
jgi:hypothetical protein